ncbi:hypothetical protein QYS48_11290 [Marivirga arenosa]|uniref:Uncharacterized protein n=1 Tax=Marivirga arenosa TaxID=3059076 RepID=A0AA49JBD9_9BACT|nr:hypothetical protein [Marivirga sp. ABR2-2]WKK87305.2 hypothetical protein QYS48_11290 [Marivirga sp. ABR2-2]
MRYLIVLFFSCFAFESLSQDTIFLKDSSEINCSIKEIKEGSLIYTRNDEISPLYELMISKVLYVEFESGRLDSLNAYRIVEQFVVENYNEADSKKAYLSGFQDGFKIYNGRSVKMATSITTFILPPLGLATTVITAGIPPNANLLIQNESPSNSYINGFQAGTILKKRKKAWQGFGLGLGITIGLSLSIALVVGAG